MTTRAAVAVPMPQQIAIVYDSHLSYQTLDAR
jgi:hypothetical protein